MCSITDVNGEPAPVSCPAPGGSQRIVESHVRLERLHALAVERERELELDRDRGPGTGDWIGPRIPGPRP
ncbi:hypothetical protein ABZY42_02650 [Streptomyces sp. NPDC006622]|uniref:hypothetical protein n=1 Tax=Streptomyces sp. NPDC006622 TaxID=3155459 RepID=UPI0033A672C6